MFPWSSQSLSTAPSEFPPPRGRESGVGGSQGAHPSPTSGVGLSLESLPTAGHHHLSTHSPVTSPAAQSLSREGGPSVLLAGLEGPLGRCKRAGGAEMWGLILRLSSLGPVLLPNFALSQALRPLASSSIALPYFSKSRSV